MKIEDAMDLHMLIEAILTLAGFFGGFILKQVFDSVNELKKTDSELAKKVNSIEVLVAGEYVKTNRFEDLSRALFHKLDKIEGKLDSKQDKTHLYPPHT